MFQDSGCMPVLVVQVGQFAMQIVWSVDVCQTTTPVNEQWLYASSENRVQEPAVLRVSPSFIYFKGVFTLYNIIIFIFIN
jgi:hypothetical protein